MRRYDFWSFKFYLIKVNRFFNGKLTEELGEGIVDKMKAIHGYS